MNKEHANSLITIFLDILGKKSLHVFGDSHSQVFSELDNVHVAHIGAATAYNLTNINSSTKGRERLMSGVAELDPVNDTIGLSFGEIDCRIHVIKQASLQRQSIESIVFATTQNYLSVIREIIQLGYSVVVLGLAGSGKGMNLHYPKVGREKERNRAMILFNDFIRLYAKRDGFLFVDIQDIAINFNTLESRHEFLKDGCHLNRFPNTSEDIQCIILSRLIQLASMSRSFSINSDLPQRINHAHGARFSLSSSYGSYPNEGVVHRSDTFFFHTDEGERQWIEIQFSEGYIIDEISIHNRKDGCFERANELFAVVYLIGDQVQPLTLDIPTNDRFLIGSEIMTGITFAPLLCHKVRIYNKTGLFMHFSNIEINGWYPGEMNN